MSQIIESFPPIVDDNSRILILGTMPGQESLERKEYYANSRNGFWRIMFTLFDSPPEWSYQRKVAFLDQKGIAIWDVLRECMRVGSSDKKIEKEIPNDFNGFFAQYPRIKFVFFNGGKAKESFLQLVRLDSKLKSRLVFKGLTSSSPANAKPLKEKIANWGAVKDCLRSSYSPPKGK